MNATLKTGIVKVTIWLMAEITLNLLGLDTIAAYGEFVLAQGAAIVTTQPTITLQA